MPNCFLVMRSKAFASGRTSLLELSGDGVGMGSLVALGIGDGVAETAGKEDNAGVGKEVSCCCLATSFVFLGKAEYAAAIKAAAMAIKNILAAGGNFMY